MRRINKRGFEFSFGWIFAIIVGAVIIFLAIYATVKIVGGEKKIQNSQTAAQLGALLSPIETSLEAESAPGAIEFPLLSRIYNECNNKGVFGEQRLSTSTKSGIGVQWPDPGVANILYNRYIFSDKTLEGKKFFVFTKPFVFPFKIADVIVIWPDKKEYCFVNAPDEIRSSIDSINRAGYKNLNYTDSIRDCKQNSTSVCFQTSKCDIDVNLDSKSVTKGKKTVYYENSVVYDPGSSIPREEYSLLFGAIFSDPALYECQVKRLSQRGSQLASLYLAKETEIASRANGCGSILEGSLITYSKDSSNLNNSIQLRSLRNDAENLGGQNNGIICALF